MFILGPRGSLISNSQIIESCPTLPGDFGDEDISNFNRTIYFGAPFIDHNQDDVTLDVGANFSVVCKSSSPITWRLPEHVDSAAVEIHTETSFDAGMPYASRLFIPNAEYTYVGFYYCLPVEDEESKSITEELVNEFKATPFYIFVNGKVVLSNVFFVAYDNDFFRYRS